MNNGHAIHDAVRHGAGVGCPPVLCRRQRSGELSVDGTDSRSRKPSPGGSPGSEKESSAARATVMDDSDPALQTRSSAIGGPEQTGSGMTKMNTVTFAGCGDAFGSGGRFNSVAVRRCRGLSLRHRVRCNRSSLYNRPGSSTPRSTPSSSRISTRITARAFPRCCWMQCWPRSAEAADHCRTARMQKLACGDGRRRPCPAATSWSKFDLTFVELELMKPNKVGEHAVVTPYPANHAEDARLCRSAWRPAAKLCRILGQCLDQTHSENLERRGSVHLRILFLERETGAVPHQLSGRERTPGRVPS